MQRIIRKIEPSALKLPAKKRVAAYARVSSGKEAMLHSLSAQVSYYSELIQKHRGWEYVGVYADEAITGTKDNRAEFQRLLADCKNGKIDMIITKSISRLARNTVTMLQTVRELKEINVDVWFEKENIHSISGDGELMLTILSSFAQEESLSVSENCKWRIRKNFSEGIPPINNRHFYGYSRNSDYGFEIVENEANIIRTIFIDYLSGKGLCAIRDKLNNMGVKSPSGQKWHEMSVREILRSEKYVGSVLLQKHFVSDHISKKKMRNKGQLQKYFVENNHEPIILKEIFYKVQEEIQRRAEKYNDGHNSYNRYPFSGKILCMNCGKGYRRKTSYANKSQERILWNCSTYLRLGKSACFAKQIPEDILLSVTAEVLGLSDFDEIIFVQQIKEIRVPEPNILIFVFNNGNIVEKIWQNKSRADSWSEGAKQQAREKQLKHLERGNNKC